ncbi:hypothetical protein V5O48_018870, partial [Marasmius crinis-equi]
CLRDVGINGSEFYKRVKADVKDPNDQDWISTDGCPICLEDHFDIGSGCLLTCTDKKKIYCKMCVTGLLETRSNELDQVECPLCRKSAYFISTKWVFPNDEEKRQAAILESSKRHRRNKKAKKRQRAAAERNAPEEQLMVTAS